MTLTIVRLYHDLLGTYGDQGNAEVLIHRARARGIDVELVEVSPHAPVPTHGNIYLLGGGEDGPQTAALEMLRADQGLNTAAARGATVFAVCAGFQLIGATLPHADGSTIAGLELINVETVYDSSPRSVGELVITRNDLVLTGFENHQGLTRLGSDVTALGTVISGVGNGIVTDNAKKTEGAQVGNIFGTYMHGPALARNPELADEVLSSAAGELVAYDDYWASAFAAERRFTLTHLRRK